VGRSFCRREGGCAYLLRQIISAEEEGAWTMGCGLAGFLIATELDSDAGAGACAGVGKGPSACASPSVGAGFFFLAIVVVHAAKAVATWRKGATGTSS
jgi:hypothetical protein